MNNECVIGIDIGGTNIRIGRTDENDQLVDFERVSSKETFKDGNISESLISIARMCRLSRLQLESLQL